MQYLNIIIVILGLTAAVSAIDIRTHSEAHCGGNTATFLNVKPGRCYANGGTAWAYSFRAIPASWRLSTRAHAGGNCKELARTENSNGKNWICHGNSNPRNSVPYTGAGYSFINKKRSNSIAFDSQDCGKPDLLTPRTEFLQDANSSLVRETLITKNKSK
jgi:hypothetical protein